MKCVNNPSFKRSHIIDEDLIGVEKQKPKLKLDKPIFIGVSSLDLSKQHMYKFYSDVMKPQYGEIFEWYILILTASYFPPKLMIYISRL